MEQRLDEDLRDHLLSYVEGRCSLAEFRRWFMLSAVKPLDALTTVPVSRRRVYDIMRILAEYGDGIWTETQLRRLLRRTSSQPLRTAAS